MVKKTFLLSFLLMSSLNLCKSTIDRESEKSNSFLGSELSKETKDYIDSIAKQIGFDKEITSSNSGKFLEYWLGYKNAIALPFLNQIYVNEEWLKSLSEDERKFLIGRSLMHLTKANDYALYTLVLPIIAYATGVGILLQLFLAYLGRKVQYDADKQAVMKLKCALGAKKLFKNIQIFENDGTVLGKISSTVPLIDLILPLGIVNNFIAGKLTNRTDRLSNFILGLPLIHYFTSYPRTKDRIDALEDLVEQEKIMIKAKN